MIDISKTATEISVDTHEQSSRQVFNPDERKTIEQSDDSYEKRNIFSPDERKLQEAEQYEDGYYTTEKERIDHTPQKDSLRGEWEGERGNSKFIPSYKFMKDRLQQYGVDGIPYNHGDVDFSSVSEGSVEIDNMTQCRHGKNKNFEQCDEKFAEKFNRDRKDDRTDWIPREVAEYIEANKLTRHECCDCKTMLLVDEEIHKYFSHSGGVAECKHRDNNIGGGFDA